MSGEMALQLRHLKGETSTIKLDNVLYAPGLRDTLISVMDVTATGTTCEFYKDQCRPSKDGKVLNQIRATQDNLYFLNTVPAASGSNMIRVNKVVTTEDWHSRLGHLGIDNMRKQQGMMLGCENGSLALKGIYDACARGRRPSISYSTHDKVHTRAYLPGEMIHSDIYRPTKVAAVGTRNRYFCTFLDESSDYSHVTLLASKGDLQSALLTHIALMERQTGNPLKVLRTDGGKEYHTSELKKYFEGQGILC